MRPHDYNLNLAILMLEEFEDYILSSEVFWPLTNRSTTGSPLPRLTLGGLLLTLNELKAQQIDMTPSQRADYEELLRHMDRVRVKWAVGLERKAAQELSSRLNLWRAYLCDIEERVDTTENYHSEVRNRVMFKHLADLSIRQPETKPRVEEMRSLDTRLRSFFTPGDFVWDPRLENIYPQSTFWYLYGLPHPRD